MCQEFKVHINKEYPEIIFQFMGGTSSSVLWTISSVLCTYVKTDLCSAIVKFLKGVARELSHVERLPLSL